jgi:hypothetical protein
MFKQRTIAEEQVKSLTRELQAHDIRHGDVVHDVEMGGVGFRTHEIGGGPLLVFAFCPMEIVSLGDIFRANRLKRMFPLPDRVLWAPGSLQVLQKSTPAGCGFARIKCDVASNGAIHLSNVRVLGIESAPLYTAVNCDGAYELFRREYAQYSH